MCKTKIILLEKMENSCRIALAAGWDEELENIADIDEKNYREHTCDECEKANNEYY